MGKFIVKDIFYNKAKQEGYRARSAYKLKEIQEKYHLIKRGDKVIDLGCAPGSFLQVLSGIIGEEGFAVGIDILPTEKLPFSNVMTIEADIRGVQIHELLKGLSFHAADVVTCDIAPNLSGIRDVDNANIEELFDVVLSVVEEGLRKGGKLIIKSFFTATLKGFTEKLQKRFQKISTYKPVSSRSVSTEVFLVCTGKK
jgi:23S rRNA (uridine2552-2'-O)-methyltransferase